MTADELNRWLKGRHDWQEHRWQDHCGRPMCRMCDTSIIPEGNPREQDKRRLLLLIVLVLTTWP